MYLHKTPLHDKNYLDTITIGGKMKVTFEGVTEAQINALQKDLLNTRRNLAQISNTFSGLTVQHLQPRNQTVPIAEIVEDSKELLGKLRGVKRYRIELAIAESSHHLPDQWSNWTIDMKFFTTLFGFFNLPVPKEITDLARDTQSSMQSSH